MGRKKKTPPPLGTVWTACCRIKVVDHDTWKWKTLATCIDGPNPIAAEIAKLRAQGYSGFFLFGEASGRAFVS